jgi:hypothetical protein
VETGRSLDAAAREARGEPIVPVEDHQDIVDKRRKALDALQHRGETDVFGWASYRDWGGLLKLFVVCPGLEQTVTGGEASDPETDTEGLTAVSETDDTELIVYGGFETVYDFRGTQTLWAKPILYFPETGAVVPDTGKRYTRRHYGRATDAAHERANDRVPITEWWQSIYDDIDLRMVEVDRTIRRARAFAYEFETLPFSTTDCYRYWGIAETYASVAAERATTLAESASRQEALAAAVERTRNRGQDDAGSALGSVGASLADGAQRAGQTSLDSFGSADPSSADESSGPPTESSTQSTRRHLGPIQSGPETRTVWTPSIPDEWPAGPTHGADGLDLPTARPRRTRKRFSRIVERLTVRPPPRVSTR